MTPLTSTSNVETVKSLYAAFLRQDLDAILASVTENVDWNHSALASRECPWNGDFSGRSKLPGFFQALAENLEFTVFEARDFTHNENSVAVRLRIEFTVKKNGRTLAADSIHFWMFDPAGKVTYYRHFNDTAQELAAWRG